MRNPSSANRAPCINPADDRPCPGRRLSVFRPRLIAAFTGAGFTLAFSRPKVDSAFLRGNRLKGCDLLFDLDTVAFRASNLFLFVFGHFHVQFKHLFTRFAAEFIPGHLKPPLMNVSIIIGLLFKTCIAYSKTVLNKLTACFRCLTNPPFRSKYFELDLIHLTGAR